MLLSLHNTVFFRKGHDTEESGHNTGGKKGLLKSHFLITKTPESVGGKKSWFSKDNFHSWHCFYFLVLLHHPS